MGGSQFDSKYTYIYIYKYRTVSVLKGSVSLAVAEFS